MTSPGRNDPCPCGSGKKYKKCCQGKADASVPLPSGRPDSFTAAPNHEVQKQEPVTAEIHQLVAMYHTGHYAELESLARLLLSQYPDSGTVWKILGASLLKQGKDALPVLQRVTELVPDEAEAHYNLGNALLRQERFQEAEVSYRQALRIQPDYVAAHGNIGNLFMRQGRLADAEASYRHALRIKPDFAEIHYNLGNVLRDMGRIGDAEESYRRALLLKADYAEAHNNRGNVLHDLGCLEDAEESYRIALRINPDYAEAYNNLGNILQEVGRLSEAEASCRQALQVNPGYASAHGSLAGILLELGRLGEASASLSRALEINPDMLEARFGIAQLHKVKPEDENFLALVGTNEAMRRGARPLPDKEATYLHFALGKCHEDVGEYEKAFSHFLEGCRLKRSTIDYDPDKSMRYFASIMHHFDEATIGRLHGGGDSSHLPIFVLGMPRSGTTLTEQIIASHPEVYGAGELTDLMITAQHNDAEAATSYPGNIASLERQQLAAWGGEYISGLKQRASEARHVTDKMPENFLFIGLIHLMLPNAKIIHVMRNPVDTCLSCFTTLFRRGQAHTYDLTELGHYYASYMRLMGHWRRVLPAGTFLDVRYEDIVADHEEQARRLIEYCGLEWDDACLEFHKSQRVVRTASLTQVRQPIYKSSVERWRNYEKYLGPLLEALGEFAPER